MHERRDLFVFVTTTQCSPYNSRRSPACAIGWAEDRQGLPCGGFHHQNVRLHTAWYRWRLGQADREGGATLLPARGTDTCLALRRLSTVALQTIHCDRKFAWCLQIVGKTEGKDCAFECVRDEVERWSEQNENPCPGQPMVSQARPCV